MRSMSFADAQAQECGEKMEMQDSMLYALDGLCGGRAATHHQSALALAELSCSRRGRLALRSCSHPLIRGPMQRKSRKSQQVILKVGSVGTAGQRARSWRP